MPEATLILKAGACNWRKCIFCGYGRIAGYKPTQENLEREFNAFFERLPKDTKTIKVFGSGSFLDEKQIPADARKYFIKKCSESGVQELVIESRPEHITVEKLGDFNGIRLTVAIGLEVADDRLLDGVKKGFHLSDYERAVEAIRTTAKVRTYLLVNIPNETDEILEKSVNYALAFSDSVVLINLLPHGNTPLFHQWVNGEWTFLSREEFAAKTERWKSNPKIELDVETFRFTPQFPPELKKPLNGVGEEYLTHPYFEVWQDYLLRWYQPPEGKNLLFLPCSRKKPYSESDTHRNIIAVLNKTNTRGLFHEVMLSNAGVIPREFEDKYPFNDYDWDERLETEEVKKRYIEVTEQRIMNYLKAHKEYINVCCYLKPDSESYAALESACRHLNIKLTSFLTSEAYEKIKNGKKPLQSSEALIKLEEGLLSLRQDSTY
jgi:hypothetical protein